MAEAGLYSGNKHLLPLARAAASFPFLVSREGQEGPSAPPPMKLGEFLQLSPRDTAVMILTRVLAKQAEVGGSMESLK